MANAISISGTYSLTNNTIRLTGTANYSIDCSGSNYVSNAQNLSTASWTPLDTSSLSDMRSAFFTNNDTTSSVALATDSSGTNRIGYLYPGDSSILCWQSASAFSLYAKGTGSANATTVNLSYIITES